jgi:acetoin utilization deacetylase AcuC-like enzyme
MLPHIWIDVAQIHHKGSYLHPEHPNRILAIQERIQTWDSRTYVLYSPPQKTSLSEIPCSSVPWTMLEGDTYITESTPELLRRGSEMIEESVSVLAAGDTGCAFVLIRPPGHHAFQNQVAGFCHQNNAWLAAKQLQVRGLERITILDWDAHHGDGTEQCVRATRSPMIRFCSLHAFGRGIYPGTGKRQESEQILNIPFPIGTDSETYLRQFYSKVMPFVEDSDAIIVSAGYDGHEKDPMGLLRLKESTYTEMAAALKEIGCPLLFLLEGGYRPDVLASCVEATLKPWLILT